jgi:hypothetical protein
MKIENPKPDRKRKSDYIMAKQLGETKVISRKK